MKRNITIKDVAREAGVSVATVSYVLNNRTDKRISEKTQKKVLQVINLLDYTPNQSAKALATNRNRNIALYQTSQVSFLKRAEQMYFIDLFSSFLHEKGYDLIYLSDSCQEKFDHADAIICYDVSSDFFRQIGDCNFIPLLALDCRIDDPLFFQINSDYQKLASKAASFFQGEAYQLVLLDTPNLEQKKLLSEHFTNICYLQNLEDIKLITSKNVLVVHHTVRELLGEDYQVCYQPSLSTEKLNALLQCMEYTLLRTPIEQHDVLL